MSTTIRGDLYHANAAGAKAAFLALISSTAITASEAARRIGRSVAWPYMTRQADPEFKKAWDAIQPVSNEVRADWYEDRLMTLSASDKNPAAVTAVIVGLKMTKRFIERDTSHDSELVATARSVLSALHEAATRDKALAAGSTSNVVEGQVVSEHSQEPAPDTEST